jgi:hypothetical protein
MGKQPIARKDNEANGRDKDYFPVKRQKQSPGRRTRRRHGTAPAGTILELQTWIKEDGIQVNKKISSLKRAQGITP